VFGIDLAVSIMDGPDLSGRRRKELTLALLMAETIGVILYTGESDSDIRIEAAKDMIREFRHVYPEIAEI
jgi:ABC-type iron transport system FetAB ATPase subunit